MKLPADLIIPEDQTKNRVRDETTNGILAYLRERDGEEMDIPKPASWSQSAEPEELGWRPINGGNYWMPPKDYHNVQGTLIVGMVPRSEVPEEILKEFDVAEKGE